MSALRKNDTNEFIISAMVPEKVGITGYSKYGIKPLYLNYASSLFIIGYAENHTRMGVFKFKLSNELRGKSSPSKSLYINEAIKAKYGKLKPMEATLDRKNKKIFILTQHPRYSSKRQLICADIRNCKFNVMASFNCKPSANPTNVIYDPTKQIIIMYANCCHYLFDTNKGSCIMVLHTDKYTKETAEALKNKSIYINNGPCDAVHYVDSERAIVSHTMLPVLKFPDSYVMNITVFPGIMRKEIIDGKKRDLVCLSSDDDDDDLNVPTNMDINCDMKSIGGDMNKKGSYDEGDGDENIDLDVSGGSIKGQIGRKRKRGLENIYSDDSSPRKVKRHKGRKGKCTILDL